MKLLAFISYCINASYKLICNG